MTLNEVLRPEDKELVSQAQKILGTHARPTRRLRVFMTTPQFGRLQQLWQNDKKFVWLNIPVVNGFAVDPPKDTRQ